MAAATSSCSTSGFVNTRSSSARSCSDPITSASESQALSRTTGSCEMPYRCIVSIPSPTFWWAEIVTRLGSAPRCFARSTSSTVGSGACRSRKPCSSIQLSS